MRNDEFLRRLAQAHLSIVIWIDPNGTLRSAVPSNVASWSQCGTLARSRMEAGAESFPRPHTQMKFTGRELLLAAIACIAPTALELYQA